MEKFQVLKELPESIGAIFWDVNGTITKMDIPIEEILKMIVAFAKKGVYQVFITGRNRFWIEIFLIKGLKKFLAPNEIEELRNYFLLFPECGLIKLDLCSGEPEIFRPSQSHPLMFSAVRETLKQFCWRREILKPYQNDEEVPKRHFIGRDAEGKLFLLPFTDVTDLKVVFPDVFWDEYKEVIGGLEGIRDINGEIPERRRKSMVETAKAFEYLLKLYGLDNAIKVSPVSTAINLVPIVNKVALDKDWTTGRGLSLIQKTTALSLEEISSHTIAIGDGAADFLFTHPIIEENPETKIPLVFVGPKEQYQPTPEQEKNVVIKAKHPYFGAEVTLEVLKFLESRLQGFITKIKNE